MFSVFMNLLERYVNALRVRNSGLDRLGWITKYLSTTNGRNDNNISWSPSPCQEQVLKDDSNKKIVITLRNQGKTDLLIVNAIHNLMTRSDCMTFIYTPNRSSTERMRKRMNDILRASELNCKCKVDQKNNSIHNAKNNSRIIFASYARLTGDRLGYRSYMNPENVASIKDLEILVDDFEYIDRDILFDLVGAANAHSMRIELYGTLDGDLNNSEIFTDLTTSYNLQDYRIFNFSDMSQGCSPEEEECCVYDRTRVSNLSF